ncbi:potassium voltage-gated channel protein Shaw-like [Littorina saxatilis]|uniref:potassium voltage-gated channel protein Shaw-like n=1 Tax=Littorina saxatilis TaxID=31220 RepID=UPI0038B5EE0E
MLEIQFRFHLFVDTELDYWGLTELDIEPCCWGHYCKFKENKETLTALDDNFTFHLEDDNVNNPPSAFTKFKRNMWIFLEDPSSTRGAKAYAIVSMFFVLLSIAVFVLETHTWFRVPNDGYNNTSETQVSGGYISTGHCSCKITKGDPDYINNSQPHTAMTYLDYLCAAFFTLEFLVRIYFAPSKLEFFKQPLNIIDILCLVPHFTSIIIKTVSPLDTAGNILRSMLALRVIRVLRIFKLMKHYTAFKILVYTIKVSTKELLLMVVFLFSGVLIFASVIYYVERETFTSIPVGFWWAIVTMTTVGYGDKVPVTEGGYIIGFMCVLCGVLTVAFTVPIVVNNFTLYYAHAQSRNQLPPQKKRELQQKLIMKNQKATEFIKRLAINVQHRRKNNTTKDDEDENFNKLEDMKSPRTTTSRSSKDSGIDACLGSPQGSPKHGGVHRGKPPLKMTEVDIDGRSSGGGGVSSRIQTVSEIVPELEIPGTPDTGFEIDSKTPQMLETEQLLHELQDFEEKKREDRRRQLELINQRRDEVRARTTPRPPHIVDVKTVQPGGKKQ